MSALIGNHMTCLPPKKCHTVRMCMLSVFSLTYFIGAGTTIHNNKHAMMGFCVVGSVLTYYTIVMICLGWKTLNQQLEDAVDKECGPLDENATPDIVVGEAITAAKVVAVAPGEKGLNASANLSNNATTADRNAARAALAPAIPFKSLYRRNCAVMMVLGFITTLLSLCGSFYYMWLGVKLDQDYTMTSYWMSFMSLLMSAKWCFMFFWLGKKLRIQRDEFLAEHGLMAPLVGAEAAPAEAPVGEVKN